MLKVIKQIKYALNPEMIQADMATLLSDLNPENSYQERLSTLAQLMEWIRLPVKGSAEGETPNFIQSRNIRFKFLFQFLERNEQEAEYLASTIKEFLVPGRAVSLYCLTGISENLGFFNEISNRAIERILPDTYTEEDLSEVLKAIFKEEEDAIWLETSFSHVYNVFKRYAEKYAIQFEALIDDKKDAMRILGAQVTTIGTTKDIRRRLIGKRLTDMSFLKLNSTITSGASSEEILKEISESRKDLQSVRDNIEISGVSVDLIFKLEKIDNILDRIEMLIYLDKDFGEESKPLVLGQFIARLIRIELKAQGIKTYLKENLHLLTRKIVERAGEKGQHYIAGSAEERKELFVAATWAGVLTAFTAICKYLIAIVYFPLFFEGFFFFINYAISFLIMQKWHLALSSKQPAYMASALARKFEAFKATKQLHDVSYEVRKIMNSQVITTLGNLLWVVPTVIALDWIWYFISGSHIMTVTESLSAIDKHNPFTSLSIPFAFLTGIILWFSSVISGWVENWIVFRDIPEAIRANSVIQKLMSRDQINIVADNFAATIGGISGNLSIAFFLAAPVIIGKFIAIPLDIRHVTLSTGTVTLAFNSLGWNILEYWPQMLTTFLGIMVIGFLNFSVSFYCALRMAALAQNVESKYLKIIFKFAFSKRMKKKDPLNGGL